MRMVYDKLFKKLSDNNLRYEDLYDKAGITLPASLAIVQGQNISKSNLNKICAFLDCCQEDIVEITDDAPVKATKPKSSTQAVPVFKCDLRGNHLKKYKSGYRAAEILGKPPGPIYDCLNSKRKTAYGFRWKFVDNT